MKAAKLNQRPAFALMKQTDMRTATLRSVTP